MADKAASNQRWMSGSAGSVQVGARPAQIALGRHWILLILCAVVIAAIVAAGVAFRHMWPFTPHGVTKRIQQHTSATVEYGRFHELFFPRPGFVAEDLVLRSGTSTQPAVTIKRLTVLSSYSGLLGPTKRIGRVELQGLVVRVSTRGPQNLEFHRGGKKEELTVGTLVADNSVLEVTTGNGHPLPFHITHLRVNSVGEHSASNFEVELQNPKPAMQIAAQGKLGPWRANDLLLTPVTGAFAVSRGQLGSIPGIDGALTSGGRFQGELGRIEVSGRAEIPGFEVRAAKHPMPLRAQYNAVVSTNSGQVAVRSVEAKLGATEIKGSGVISPKREQSPDLVNLTLTSDHGRIDDLLRLFVSSPRPAMDGPIVFRTKALVERGDGSFLKRVLLIGDFEINNAHFTAPDTQGKLDELSARAEGNKKEQDDPPDRAVSTLAGHVNMKDGIASLSDITFQVPGADATGGGTFNVIDRQVHIDGTLWTKNELSQTTKGVKSFLLKFLDPFFKRRQAGAEVPVHLRGTSKEPKFTVGLK